MSPENPPIENRNKKAIANSIGGSKDSEPRHMVAVQLKTFTPVGTAISMVDIMKNNCAAMGIPSTNMWWPHTMNDKNAIEAMAYIIDVAPNRGFRENVGRISEMMPKAGKIMM